MLRAPINHVIVVALVGVQAGLPLIHTIIVSILIFKPKGLEVCQLFRLYLYCHISL